METILEYKKLYNDFIKLKKLSNEISSFTINKKCTKYEEIASWVFTKNIAHIYSFDKLLPDINKANELWDLSSLASIARSIIDAYYVMYYISFETISSEEKEFRFLLFQYHSEKSRYKMLKLMNTTHSLSEIEKDIEILYRKIESSKLFSSLEKTTKRNIKKGEKSRLLTNTELSKKSGINENYYNAVFKHLSNYIHTYPFSINDLSTFRAGTEDAINSIGLFVQYVINYLALSIEGYLLLDICKENFSLNQKELELIYLYTSIPRNIEY